MCACGGDDSGDIDFTTEWLDVKDREVVMGANERTKTIAVEANCSWTAQLSGAWEGLTVNPSTGLVTLNTPVNTAPTRRSATLTIRSQSGKVTRSVTIHQDAAEVTLEVSSLTTFSGDGGTQQFTIQTNSTWKVEGFTSWCQAEGATSGSGNGTVTVRVEANPNETGRSVNLIVTAGGTKTAPVGVTQSAATTLRASGDVVKNVDAQSGSAEFNVVGTAQWTASITQMTGNWARITQPAGEVTGNGMVSVAYEANTTQQQREVVITINWARSSVAPIQFQLTQEAATLPVPSVPVASAIDRTSATLTASYSSDFPVTRYGFCYTTLRDKAPDLTDTVVSFTGNSSTGNMTATLSGLASGRRYYVRAFAESSVGIAYSDIMNFTTIGDTPNEGDNVPPTNI